MNVKIVKSKRLSLKYDYLYWRRYYGTSFVIFISGIVLIINNFFGTSSSVDNLYIGLCLMLLGGFSFYWLYGQLKFREHLLPNKLLIEEFRTMLTAELVEEGWKVKHNNKRLLVARKKRELMVFRYYKSKVKWLICGDFVGIGWLNMLFNKYKSGKSILKKIGICDL